MTKFEQIFLQKLDIKISGKNVQISLQEYLCIVLTAYSTVWTTINNKSLWKINLEQTPLALNHCQQLPAS